MTVVYERVQMTAIQPVIIVHGGAGSTQFIPDNKLQESKEGIKKAARAGYTVLNGNGSALDAVQAAICSLEDNPVFDAGCGSVLTSDGEIEMDAVVMCGKQLEAGGVACVQNIKNPIVLARKVKEEKKHVLLVGKGANKFATEVGVKTVPKRSLLTEEAEADYKRHKSGGYAGSVEEEFGERKTHSGESSLGHDTVGAVAMDKDGNLAYGTSTGGITFKQPGRVGDSPIIGAGGYADNEVGAVSCTGHGESFMKVCLAYHVITLMRIGLNPEEAATVALKHMGDRVKGYGGVIVLNKKGQIAKSFTTDRMTWAWARDNVLHFGIKPDEDDRENI